ncbi:MAG: hypothetical protein FWG46_00325 [Treponema sp.]|nr:hypothetical protein [Treponema sp.]
MIISIFFLASCVEMFQAKIAAPESTTTLGDLFLDQGTGKLATPEHFMAAQYFSASEIRLAWDETPRAAYYMVERAVAVPDANGEYEEPEDYSVLEKIWYGRFYEDIILASPDLESPEYLYRYYYRVSAYSAARGLEESDPTEPQFAMLLCAPGNVQATTGTSDNVTVRWDYLSAAVVYEIWRSTEEGGGNSSLLAAIPGNQNWYENRIAAQEQGVNFFYTVRAMNSYGNKSLQSFPAYGYSRVFGAPNEPRNVRLPPGTGRGNSRTDISIQWDAAGEAGAKYAVYRYSSVNSQMRVLTPPGGISETHFTDETAGPGVYYYYLVQAITPDPLNNDRELKSPLSADAAEGFVISPPETVMAHKAGDVVTVKWLPPIGSINELNMYTYNIWWSLDDYSYSLAGNVSSTIGADGYLSAAVNSSGIFFRVSTVNGGVESATSVSTALFPEAAVMVSVSRYENIPGMGAANANGVYPVRISWKKPENDAPEFYRVQRSLGSGAGFNQINDIRLGANGPFIAGLYTYDTMSATYSYIDQNQAARPGRQFAYRVLSLNRFERGDSPSEERIGWGALTPSQYMLEFNKTMGKSALKKLTYMHKPGATDKLGSETKYGTISGSIYYNAAISGLGARIIIRLENYADFYIDDNPSRGVYFALTGNSNTTANMSQSGTMDGTMRCEGMYPGYVDYDDIVIRGGAASGGTYGIHMDGGFQREEISWLVGEQ